MLRLSFAAGDILHVPPILAAHLVQRAGDLAEAAIPHGFHELGKNVTAGQHDFLQLFKGFGRFVGMLLLEIVQPGELGLFFLGCGACQVDAADAFRKGFRFDIGITEGVDPMMGRSPVCLSTS